LTSFAAALLMNFQNASDEVVDFTQLQMLHELFLDFVRTVLNSHDKASAKGKEVYDLMQGVITTYAPMFLGNQMLYWANRYWESCHEMPSHRLKASDLVNPDLDEGFKTLGVAISWKILK
jgi:hypothetical protein